MSDSNRVALSYEKEGATYKTAPASALTDIRYTGESLTHETNSVSSAEIRSDRQVPDVTRVGIGAAGDTNHELSHAEFDQWIESALLSAAATSAVADISGVNATSVGSGDGVYTLDAGTWSTTPTVGGLLEIRGDAVAANNGYKVVTAATTTTVTVSETGTTTSAAQDLTIDILAEVVNGTTFASYHLQKEYEDLTNIFALMVGSVIDGWTIDASLEGLVTMVFNWMGSNFTDPAPASTFAARGAVTSNEVMNTVDHIPTIGEGATHASTDLTAFNMALKNNLRALNILGTIGADSIGTGKVDVTGNIQFYFEDNAIMNKYTGNTATELLIVFEDTLGNGIVLYLPQVKFTSGAANAGGQDADVIGDFGYTAYRDSTFDYTVKVARFAA